MDKIETYEKKNIMKYLVNMSSIRIHHFWQNIYIKPIILKMNELVNLVNDALIYLRNVVYKKGIIENENPDKEIYIAEKIFYFNKQQKGKRRKTLTLQKCFKN